MSPAIWKPANNCLDIFACCPTTSQYRHRDQTSCHRFLVTSPIYHILSREHCQPWLPVCARAQYPTSSCDTDRAIQILRKLLVRRTLPSQKGNQVTVTRAIRSILLSNLRFEPLWLDCSLREIPSPEKTGQILNEVQRDTSMLTFESSQTQGAAAITEKLVVGNKYAARET